MTTYKYSLKPLAALLPVALAFMLVACSTDDFSGGYTSPNSDKALNLTADEAAQ